jgi:hypothetical protein
MHVQPQKLDHKESQAHSPFQATIADNNIFSSLRQVKASSMLIIINRHISKYDLLLKFQYPVQITGY